ncbi:MAG TPA: orotidine-5'-phosphate decarboxylase [Candidatus Latescibacteria bacterium]|nr:orotidine-5'-phosphate decarboxylase [Candidatus Latescibacterota bacterium]|tara:strand:+ start:2300 stop:3139 length:840 start_codon:yes stop_codon:yes gene_type:complete
MSTFKERLAGAVERHESLVCVGLDPVPERLPAGISRDAEGIAKFNHRLIEATADIACCFKPNFPFYGALGAPGFEALKKTIDAVPDDVPVLLDCKVGDIGSTADRWAHMVFVELGADAVVVNPYMGTDALTPFLEYEDRGVFVLCHTSNPGAAEFQRLSLDGAPLFEHVVRKTLEWDETHNNCGIVVGATQAGSMARLRRLAPDLPFLVPGVGSQGGDLQGAVSDGLRADGAGLLINASRSIIFASDGADFPEAARQAAETLRQQINSVRKGRSIAQSG